SVNLSDAAVRIKISPDRTDDATARPGQVTLLSNSLVQAPTPRTPRGRPAVRIRAARATTAPAIMTRHRSSISRRTLTGGGRRGLRVIMASPLFAPPQVYLAEDAEGCGGFPRRSGKILQKSDTVSCDDLPELRRNPPQPSASSAKETFVVVNH